MSPEQTNYTGTRVTRRQQRREENDLVALYSPDFEISSPPSADGDSSGTRVPRGNEVRAHARTHTCERARLPSSVRPVSDVASTARTLSYPVEDKREHTNTHTHT